MTDHIRLPLQNPIESNASQNGLDQLLVQAHRLASATQFKQLLVLLADYSLEQTQGDLCIIALPNISGQCSGQWHTYSFQAEDGFRTRADEAIETEAIIFPSPCPLEQDNPSSSMRRIQQLRHLQMLSAADANHSNTSEGLLEGFNFTSEHWHYHPLIHRKECIGIVYIEHIKDGPSFTLEQRQIANFLVGHGAIALSNLQLHESVITQAAAIDASIDGVAILENDRFIYHNPVFAGLFGYDSQELMGQTWSDLYPTEELTQIQEHVLPVLMESGQWRGKSMGLRRDGSIFHTELTLFQLEDKKLICICRNISEEKDADFFFKLSQYSVDNAADCIFWIKQDGTIFYANHAASLLYGYELDDLITMSIFDLSPCLSQEQWTKQWHQVKVENHCKIESEHISKKNSVLPVEITANHLDFEGEEYIFFCVRDISDSRQQKQKLYESQQLLQLVLDTIPQLVFWKDQDSNYMGCNQGFASIAGLEVPDEILGKTDYDLPWKTSESEFFIECDRRIMTSGEAELGIIEPQLTAKGKQTWVETNKTPLRDPDGNVIGILGTVQDITPQKEAERALKELNETLEQRVAKRTSELQESQAFLQSVMDTIPQSIFWKDTHARFLGCNQNFLTTVGASSVEEVIEKTDEDINLPWRYEAAWFRECDRRVIELDAPDLDVIEPQLRPDGSQGWLEISRVPLHNSTEEVIGVLGVFQDVTQRKQSEDALQLLNSELQDAKEAADAASQAKSEFLASMSHELRTPLNGILGYAQILGRSDSLREKEQHGLSVIQECGNHLLNLINDILELAKIEARKLELHPAPAHLPSILKGVTEMCRIRADQKGIGFDYQVNESLPEHVIVDEKRLCQVLINLLGNAIKFTEKGQVSMHVQANKSSVTSAQNALIKFTIIDTGIGIADTDIKRLFRSFEQVGDQQKKAEGTGLGLAISQQIIQMMDSSINVTSQVGVGSEFSFEITLPTAMAASAARYINPSKKRILGYEGEQQKVLIVDDAIDNRSILHELLAPLKFEIIEASNGEEALAHAKSFHPDLIITDLVMPVMNGHELLQQVRQDPSLSTTKFIISSASVSPKDRQTSLDLGSDYFIGKPIDIDELLGQIQASLNLRWLYEESKEEVHQQKNSPAQPQDELLPKPDPATLQKMLDLIQRGRVPKLLQLIQDSCDREPAHKSFLEPLKSLAMKFELEELESICQANLLTEASIQQIS